MPQSTSSSSRRWEPRWFPDAIVKVENQSASVAAAVSAETSVYSAVLKTDIKITKQLDHCEQKSSLAYRCSSLVPDRVYTTIYHKNSWSRTTLSCLYRILYSWTVTSITCWLWNHHWSFMICDVLYKADFGYYRPPLSLPRSQLIVSLSTDCSVLTERSLISFWSSVSFDDPLSSIILGQREWRFSTASS